MQRTHAQNTGHDAEQKNQQEKQPETPAFSQKKFNWKAVLIPVVTAIILISAYGVYSLAKPGPYDSFAKCLTENGVEVYGALEWCEFTQAQKAMFGNSFQYLNYKEHTEMEGIKVTPTWIIDGEWHERVQSMQQLSQLSGCEI